MTASDAARTLITACSQVGLEGADAEPIRLGENALFRLPKGIVARVSRPGQQTAAAKEVRVSRWLQGQKIPVVSNVSDIDQPVEVDGRSVTFWHELPPHSQGTYTQVAELIKQVHAAPPPDFLPPLDPFVRLGDRIQDAQTFSVEEHSWMREHLANLEHRYADLPSGLPLCVIHGDAHGGNVAVLEDGRAILLDLERFSIGPPEWDLMLAAFDYGSCGWMSKSDYEEFVITYGHDVMDSPRYAVLRDIREFRKMLFAAQLAAEIPRLREQAAHRLASLRGHTGTRPWRGWEPVP